MYSKIDKVFFFKKKIENRYSITFLFENNLQNDECSFTMKSYTFIPI